MLQPAAACSLHSPSSLQPPSQWSFALLLHRRRRSGAPQRIEHPAAGIAAAVLPVVRHGCCPSVAAEDTALCEITQHPPPAPLAASPPMHCSRPCIRSPIRAIEHQRVQIRAPMLLSGWIPVPRQLLVKGIHPASSTTSCPCHALRDTRIRSAPANSVTSCCPTACVHPYCSRTARVCHRHLPICS